ncbi:MAG: hypothetical protein ACKPKO_42285, partial [Candidatus Fonsibacter sp.]
MIVTVKFTLSSFRFDLALIGLHCYALLYCTIALTESVLLIHWSQWLALCTHLQCMHVFSLFVAVSVQ